MDWNKDTAYFAGYVLGDGCLWIRDGKYYINISSCDKEVIEYFSKWLKQPLLTTKYVTVKGLHREIYKVEFRSKKIYEFLGSIGIGPRKSYIDREFSIREEFLEHFLRGLFDSDGCVSITKKFECKVFVAGRYCYMNLINEMTKFEGSHLRKMGNIYKLCCESHLSVKCFYNFIYPEGQYFFLKRKKEKFDSYFSNTGVKYDYGKTRYLIEYYTEHVDEIYNKSYKECERIMDCSGGTVVNVLRELKRRGVKYMDRERNTSV